jgi:hypothetical protein
MTMGEKQAAKEIGELVSRILSLAPIAGLHVGIKITDAKSTTPKGQP